MEWFLSLFTEWKCSLVIFFGFILFSVIVAVLKKCGKNIPIVPGHIIFLGTFVSAVFYFLPWYALQLTPWQNFFTSIQHAFRLFSFDGDFVEKVAGFQGFPPEIKEFYITYGSFLYAFAPILTLSFILSFFKNIISHLKYLFYFWTTAHIFSELNEKTLALADSIKKRNKPFLFIIPRDIIVFTDIIDEKEEQSLELMEKAKSIGAILFRKDIESIRFKRKHSLRKVNFYLISQDESEKIRHAESIMDTYDFNGVKLRVFSDNIRTELLMTTKETNNIEVIRINDIQSLIYDNLDKNGINLFQRARLIKDEKELVISAVIVGLGKYGKEKLKALTWYCQLEGYKLKINVFDADKKAEEKFKKQCPELMSEEYNKKHKKGEPYYEITIHSGVDIYVPDFEERLKKITDATYIFVCLGDDEANFSAATEIRSMCQRIDYKGNGRKPDIETVIYDSNVKKRMGITWDEIKEYEKAPEDEKPIYGATNFKKQQYQILIIGDLKNFYSYDTVIESDLINAGLKIHTDYSLEYQRIRFAEDRMMKKWEAFINKNGLNESWEAHLENWKKEKRKNDGYALSDAKGGFSFMNSDEEKKSKENANSLLEMKNKATPRIIEWEKAVYKEFENLKNNPTAFKEWEKIEKNEVIFAKKSFLFEYNYRSSIAKAIHKRLKKKLNFKQELLNKKWETLTLDEKLALGTDEHIRWNAYMRTEGYSHNPKRDDLARLHKNLVPVSELSNDDLRKDA